MVEDRCRHDFLIAECGYCTPRPGSIDLHTASGRRSEGSGYAQEVTDTVFVDGLSYGLVPSGGEAYVFGGGHGLHHRVECNEGGDTPPERILRLPDPNNDLWQKVARRSGNEVGPAIKNIDGRPVTVCCGVCALRPIAH